MKICFLGNFKSEYSSENEYKKVLEDMDIEVIALQENEADVDVIIQEGIASDAFFWVHTHGWNPTGNLTMREALKAFEKRGIPSFSYHLDLWLGLDRENDMYRDAFWEVKYKFMVDGELASRHNHFWVPPAIAPQYCFKGKKRPDFEHEVIFVGSKEYHPEWPNRGELIEKLAERYGDGFRHYGKGGQEAVRGKDLNDLYASAKLVVGDSLCPTFEKPHYWSDRATETMGRGGFLLHPYIKGMELFFQPGLHLDYYLYQDFEGLFNKIDYYLEHPEKREFISGRGRENVKQRHTYGDRFNQIFSILSLLEPKFKEAYEF